MHQTRLDSLGRSISNLPAWVWGLSSPRIALGPACAGWWCCSYVPSDKHSKALLASWLCKVTHTPANCRTCNTVFVSNNITRNVHSQGSSKIFHNAQDNPWQGGVHFSKATRQLLCNVGDISWLTVECVEWLAVSYIFKDHDIVKVQLKLVLSKETLFIVYEYDGHQSIQISWLERCGKGTWLSVSDSLQWSSQVLSQVSRSTKSSFSNVPWLPSIAPASIDGGKHVTICMKGN